MNDNSIKLTRYSIPKLPEPKFIHHDLDECFVDLQEVEIPFEIGTCGGCGGYGKLGTFCVRHGEECGQFV